MPTTAAIEKWLRRNHPFKCYYTGEELDWQIQIDHKIPISRGGKWALSNLCITSGILNSAKGTMTDLEFKQLLGVVLTWEDKGKILIQRLAASFNYGG